MSTKKIAINPEFFKLTNISSKKKSKKEKKKKPSSDLVKKDLKKQLISKVNEHRNKIQKDKLINESKKEIKEIPDNIDQSLEYLNNLARKKVEKKRKKREKKNKNKNKTFKITDSADPSTDRQPPYSNLKNSTRPTYSQWRKTLKNRDNEDKEPQTSKHNISFGNGDEITTDIKIFEDSFDERQNKLHTLKQTLATDNNEKKEKKKVKRKHKTVKRKITLGKHKNRVGVLIKNKKTRKNIKSEIDVLKKKSINQMKKYLRKHNFIKIGSSAPNDVLKDMFVDLYTSGDVYNTSPDILLHNYIGDQK